MVELCKEDLLNVVGGASWSGNLINSIVKGATSFYNIGRSLGSAIRRLVNGKLCPI